MKKEIYKYFTDFDKLKVSRKNNSIILQDNQIKLENNENTGTPVWSSNHVLKYVLGKYKFYVKNETPAQGLYGIASSRMYGDLNILTPQVFPVITSNEKGHHILHIGSEDVYSLKDIEIAEPENVICEILELKNKTRHTNPPTMWSALYDNSEKQMFLEVMTEKCFDELINVFMLDTLRTDSDRHINNYFFYRMPGHTKFDGIIPIDLEFGDILYFNFEEIQHLHSMAYTPCGITELIHQTHKDKINSFKNLIHTDKISNRQISLLAKAINYDLPKKVKDMSQHYGLNEHLDDVYSPVSKLWEYNYKHLYRELL